MRESTFDALLMASLHTAMSNGSKQVSVPTNIKTLSSGSSVIFSRAVVLILLASGGGQVDDKRRFLAGVGISGTNDSGAEDVR
jgi:uncharacterized protein GlcG (DUF336 family)